ncbi:glycosyltransferase [Brachyspira suanatina]|uniref:Glycosyltransferase n=1 Tax=Brachyspira suanatina TaxID=381802 RepID=A0A0G4KB18_9SPIR|nr:ATP-grasp fold amidoligase family protein [Brachyspira suanatina]CRF35684.1 glycosyltransferase [Brachyspira suanatina]
MTKEENIEFREKIIKEQFRNALGYELNLENPRTFNEKLQWLKLYYHDPLMTKCADKYLVREYIKETIGEKYLIPLIGVWDKVEDINFDSLPNQFVLKVNWGSGQNIIVKDKSQLDIEETKNKLRYWMLPTSNHYYYSYEWPYKNIEPKIICEKYISFNKSFFDHKIYCFNGKPYFMHIVENPHSNYTKVNMYDINGHKLDLIFDNYEHIQNLNDYTPQYLALLFKLSSQISNHFINARVDFYIMNNNIYFGEITFTPSNGIGKFEPQEWDYKFGELLKLPKEKILEYDVLDKESIIKEACNLEPIVKQYRDLESNFNYTNINNTNTINYLNNELSNYNNTIKYIRHTNEELRLNLNWFSILSIFGIQLFAISNNNHYLRLTILGIKLTFKVNEESINKIAWWIPIRKWRDSFRTKFKIEDQTRPDQTRPDQTRPNFYTIYFYISYNKTKNQKLQPMLPYYKAA